MTDASNAVDLLKKIGKGDKESMTTFAEIYTPKLVEYIKSRFSSVLAKEDIQDIVQQTFLSVFMNADKFKSDSEQSARNWVYAIAGNQALKWVEVMKRANVEGILQDKFDWKDIENKIAMPNFDFTQQEKEIMRLISEGYSLKEIADELGISPPRVAQRFSLILNKMRENLAP